MNSDMPNPSFHRTYEKPRSPVNSNITKIDALVSAHYCPHWGTKSDSTPLLRKTCRKFKSRLLHQFRVQPLCAAFAILPLAVYVLFSTAPQANFTISILNCGLISSMVVWIAALPQSRQCVPNFFIASLLVMEFLLSYKV